MRWGEARARLGSELIASRSALVARWRARLEQLGHVPCALEGAAGDLILQAGAALADEMPAESPWRRCGGLLRIEARTHGRALPLELTELWAVLAERTARDALSAADEASAHALLGHQLEAALRGAAAEVRAALLDEPIDDPALRFGGVRVLVWGAPLTGGLASDSSQAA